MFYAPNDDHVSLKTQLRVHRLQAFSHLYEIRCLLGPTPSYKTLQARGVQRCSLNFRSSEQYINIKKNGTFIINAAGFQWPAGSGSRWPYRHCGIGSKASNRLFTAVYFDVFMCSFAVSDVLWRPLTSVTYSADCFCKHCTLKRL